MVGLVVSPSAAMRIAQRAVGCAVPSLACCFCSSCRGGFHARPSARLSGFRIRPVLTETAWMLRFAIAVPSLPGAAPVPVPVPLGGLVYCRRSLVRLVRAVVFKWQPCPVSTCVCSRGLVSFVALSPFGLGSVPFTSVSSTLGVTHTGPQFGETSCNETIPGICGHSLLVNAR